MSIWWRIWTDRRLDFHFICLLLGCCLRSCMDVRGTRGVERNVEQRAEQAVGRNKEAGSLPQGADPDHRRGHGHHDPGLQTRGGGLSG
ncbi:hypothetical protein AERO8C_70649 [Aeromonas veronii]|uniref:Uncharacterized protein n=1 Tax=Aeromonas veronii TaxID=654 RepID=A0A653LC94_AERVE|nr:hypothetical protein AERO8C_70649 [Aeromonas veronii]